VCSAAIEITVGELEDCANNTLEGDLTNAWNDFGVPNCELPGILPNVYYTFNTGDFDEITIDITAGNNSGPEIGYLLLESCGTAVSETVSDPCSYNATVTGPITVTGLEENTEYTIMIFSNLDFGNSAGTFSLCISGDDTNSINESEESTVFSLYPNPNNGNFSIEFGADYGLLTVEILQYDGRLVKSEMVNANAGSRLDMNADLSSGIYMVRLIDAAGRANVKRVIVE
jgi:hypothetical protein